MADTFTLEIVSPAKILFSGEVDTVTAPAINGEFGVLAGHTEFLAILVPGEVKYTSGGSTVSMVVSSGYSEVGPKKTSILVESATLTSDIDLNKAEAELKETTKALADMTEEESAYRDLMERSALASAMIEVAGKPKGH